MEKTWIVVADSSRARIFGVDPKEGDLKEVQEMEHPMSRARGSEIITDTAGTDSNRMGAGPHPINQGEDPKEHEARMFCKELAEAIDRGRSRKQFDNLVLISSPAFLGQLRKATSAATNKSIVKEIDKNLTHLKKADIQAHLEKEMPF